MGEAVDRSSSAKRRCTPNTGGGQAVGDTVKPNGSSHPPTGVAFVSARSMCVSEQREERLPLSHTMPVRRAAGNQS